MTVERNAEGGVTVKLQTREWEVNVWGATPDFLKPKDIRAANWNERRSIRAGESADAPVFWAIDGQDVTMLIGRDDETWDVALTIPVSAIDKIVRLVTADPS